MVSGNKNANNDTINTVMRVGALTVLLILGTYNSVFVFAAILLSATYIINGSNAIGWLVYLNSFSTIFKISPSGQSMTFVLIMLYVLYSIYKNHELNKNFVFMFMIFSIFIVITSSANYDIARIVKFLFGLLFIYYALSDISTEYGVWKVFKFYIWGVLISSIVAYSGIVHNSSAYFVEKTLGYVDAYQSRFAGMYSDPNYYTVNIIISISLVIILGVYKKINKTYEYCLIAALVSFSFLTLSKSAMLMLVIPIMVIILYCVQTKQYKKLTGVICLLVFVIFVVISLDIPQVATIIGRFTGAKDINGLTTGRSYIWELYFDYFSTHFGKLIFGSGVGAPLVNNRAAHNTYIDFIFYFGLLGSFLFVSIIIFFNISYSAFKRNILNYSVHISIIIAYLALSETFYFDFPVHIYLAATVFRLQDYIANGNSEELE